MIYRLQMTPADSGISARLTDATLYTGAHKERFDAATGKGKGKIGREDAASDGYVAAYKNKGAYDKQQRGGKQ